VRYRRQNSGGDFNFVHNNGNENRQFGTELFVHHRIISELNRVEFDRDCVSYIVLIGPWCNVIVQNVLAPCEEKSDDKRESFFEEL